MAGVVSDRSRRGATRFVSVRIPDANVPKAASSCALEQAIFHRRTIGESTNLNRFNRR